MRLRSKLNELARVVLEEAEKNPEFSARLEAVLGDGAKMPRTPPGKKNYVNPSEKSRKNRRSPAVLDPIALAEEGESALRVRLSELSLEQLRDIVSDYGMDPGKLVMKWKQPERVIERIVEISILRAKKGEVFLRNKGLSNN